MANRNSNSMAKGTFTTKRISEATDPQGDAGPMGPPGPQGPAGPAGPPGETVHFGKWEGPYLLDIVFHADTDAFVCVLVYYYDKQITIRGYSDSKFFPETARAVDTVEALTSGGFTMPVRKGDNWYVTSEPEKMTAGSYMIYYLPLSA